MGEAAEADFSILKDFEEVHPAAMHSPAQDRRTGIRVSHSPTLWVLVLAFVIVPNAAEDVPHHSCAAVAEDMPGPDCLLSFEEADHEKLCEEKASNVDETCKLKNNKRACQAATADHVVLCQRLGAVSVWQGPETSAMQLIETAEAEGHMMATTTTAPSLEGLSASTIAAEDHKAALRAFADNIMARLRGDGIGEGRESDLVVRDELSKALGRLTRRVDELKANATIANLTLQLASREEASTGTKVLRSENEDLCPSSTRVTQLAQMNYSQFRGLLDLPSTPLKPETKELGVSTSGCRSSQLFNKCSQANNWWAQSTGATMSSANTQALWSTFCEDCNSIPFSGDGANGNDGDKWAAYNLHAASSSGCADDADGNSLCQIQVCGKHVEAAVSPSYQDELFATDVTLPSKCSITGHQGLISSVAHITFMVECGEMSKLSVCVAHEQATFFREKTCFVKKQCRGKRRIGLRKLYINDVHRMYHFNAWEGEGVAGADVSMWLAALEAAEPEMYSRMVHAQCGYECGAM